MSWASAHRVGKCLSRSLRHPSKLQVSVLGFCWVHYFIDELARGNNRCDATPNDIFYAVARCPNHRFQVDAVDADSPHARSFPKHTHIIGAVQGHGGRAQDHIAAAAAHRRVTARLQAPFCCHA